MTDVQRDRTMRLMAAVEELEERIEGLRTDLETVQASPEPRDGEVAQEELAALEECLAEVRNELARVSDGCGHQRHEKDRSWQASCTDGRVRD